MSCVWGVWWHLPAAFLLTIAGIIGHELAHLLAMKPIAEDVKLHISNIWMANMYVESEIKNESWRHRWADAAGFAPIISASVIVAVLWTTGNLPDHTTVLGWGVWHALIWFGLLGGMSDYSRAASTNAAEAESSTTPGFVRAMSDGGQEFVEAEQRLLTTVLVGLLAAAVGLLYYGGCGGLVSTTGFALASLAILLSVSATGILLKRTQEYDIEVFEDDGQNY